MAFPSDTGPYTHIGPTTDRRALAEVSLGDTIEGAADGETGILVTNTHRGYTTGQRYNGPGAYWGPDPDIQEPAYSLDNTGSGSVSAWTEVTRQLWPRAQDRQGADIAIDHEDCNIRVTLLRADTGATISGPFATGASTGRTHNAGVTLSGVTQAISTRLYVLIELQANASSTGNLYSWTVYEDNAAP